MQYWIFISYPYSDFNYGTIKEIFGDSAHPIKWLIGEHTRFKKRLRADDKVLFYQAGEVEKKIVASGALRSDLRTDEKQRDYVLVGDIELFVTPLLIKKILGYLSFVKDVKHWGIYFQGGITKIQEKDYKLILRKAKIAQ